MVLLSSPSSVARRASKMADEALDVNLRRQASLVHARAPVLFLRIKYAASPSRDIPSQDLQTDPCACNFYFGRRGGGEKEVYIYKHTHERERGVYIQILETERCVYRNTHDRKWDKRRGGGARRDRAVNYFLANQDERPRWTSREQARSFAQHSSLTALPHSNL